MFPVSAALPGTFIFLVLGIIGLRKLLYVRDRVRNSLRFEVVDTEYKSQRYFLKGFPFRRKCIVEDPTQGATFFEEEFRIVLYNHATGRKIILDSEDIWSVAVAGQILTLEFEDVVEYSRINPFSTKLIDVFPLRVILEDGKNLEF